jgi:hypothetical protein
MKAWNANPTDEDRIEVFDSFEEARAQFGENYAGFVFRLTRTQIEALLQGRVVAFDINGREYAGFLALPEATHE